MRNMPSKLTFLLILTFAPLTVSAAENLADSIEGVWHVTSRTTSAGETNHAPGPGQYIFAGGHYSAIHTSGSGVREPSAVSFQPTDQEKISQFETIIVNAGPYEISGSQVTLRPMIAKSPEFVGGVSTLSFEIDGDNLILRTLQITAADGGSPTNVGGSMTLRRAR